jgi:hypothetical protein
MRFQKYAVQKALMPMLLLVLSEMLSSYLLRAHRYLNTLFQEIE